MMPASFDNIVLRPPAELVANIADQAAANQAEAQALDRDAEFPVQGLAGLARAGALLAVLPRAHGGNGFGTDPAMALQTATLLISIGRGSIALGRIFEAHMNAVRLIMRHGTEAQTRAMAQEVRAGALFGLWVTNDGDGVELLPTGGGMQYRGAKIFCSAARHATHALITARHAGETVMCIVKLGTGECVRDLPGGLAGVRGARTGCVDLSFVPAHIGSIIGAPGAYLAEPDFSTGAWRALAVSVGAMEAIVEATRAELLVRGRADAPQQRERFGRMMIQLHTARMWLHHVARIAEDADRQVARAVACVSLSRGAIETECLEMIALVQRSLGLSAFRTNNPVERMLRDLATYLRQPAPDEALDEAARYFAGRPVGTDL